jgi:hypothetical protein
MADTSRLIALAVGGLVVCLAQPLRAQAPQPASRSASVFTGTIESLVQDENGAPVIGAVVSATGASTAYGVTDRFGRATLRALPPGPYLIRAHMTGFGASRGQTVQVLASTRASSSIALRHVNTDAATSVPAIVPASFGALPEAAVPVVDDPAPLKSSDADDKGDDEVSWRLRHARRSVLKDAVDQAVAAEPADLPASGGSSDHGHGAASPATAAHLAANFFADTPFFGQVNLLTTSNLDAALDLFSTKALASHSVTNILLGAPVGTAGDWTVRAALTQGDIASWVVFGDYVTRAQARHRYDFGLSYSTQRYDGGNFLALRNVTDGSRNVGTMHGFDTFAIAPAVSVTYGARYGHYDYLDGKNLVSPKVAIVLTPAQNVRVNGMMSVRSLAPGAEEFMPPADTGIWLPPQRTFSAAVDGAPLLAERTLHLEAGIERDLTKATTLSLRAFDQHIDNQIVTLFTPATLGHYFVANGGPVQATGYAAGIKTVIAERIHGSVEYSFARADRSPVDLAYFVFVGPTAALPMRETVHDVSTAIETDVPETSTHFAVLCRISDGFAQQISGRALDARFDVQVRQALPFMDFSSAKWEMLVAVRNFFHDASSEQSIYDELLVLRAPTRVVGGLTLRF